MSVTTKKARTLIEAIDTKVLEAQSQPINSQAQATLGPPYNGITRAGYVPSNVFWEYPPNPWKHGYEIVSQMGTHAGHPGGEGFRRLGYWKRFYPTRTGVHLLQFKIDAGPITNVGSATTSAVAWVGGQRIPPSLTLPPTRGSYTRYFYVWAFLRAGYPYNLHVAGEISAKVPNRNQQAYGEIIVRFPSIKVYPPAWSGATVAEEADAGDALTRLNEALAGSEDLAAAAATLAETLPEAGLEFKEFTGFEEAVRFAESPESAFDGEG